MRRTLRLGASVAVAVAALAASACTSSGNSSSGGTPTSGGTATFALQPGTTPNYIFPMLTAAYYSVANIEQFQRLSFRSLYWIGNGQGQPVVDPAMSLAAPPTYSDHDSVATIHLGNYKWSNGQPVTTRDVAFWINLLKANKASFAAYIPGEFPDNLKSYKIVNAKTIQLTLTGSFNPTWFTYDQLSQITPLPTQVMDKTSASGKAGNYDQTTAGAKQVFNFLTAQSKDTSTYGTNPLWETVDGPWKLVSYQSTGYAKFQANPAYAGPTKPKLKYFVEQPYTTDSAELNVLRSGSTINYGYLPEQEAAQSGELSSQGYTTTPWTGWGTTFFLMNWQNPTTGPLVKQAYIRQAMQSLIDESSYVKGPLKGYGHVELRPGAVTAEKPLLGPVRDQGPLAVLAGQGQEPAVQPRLVGQAERRGHLHLPRFGRGPVRAGHQGRHPAQLHAEVRQRHRLGQPDHAGPQVAVLAGRDPDQPGLGSVRLDHQPAHAVQGQPGVVLLADAELRRRLDLRGGPLSHR